MQLKENHIKYCYLLEQSRKILNEETRKYFLILEKEHNHSSDTTVFYINSFYLTGNYNSIKHNSEFLLFDEIQLLYLLTAPEKNNPRTNKEPLERALKHIIEYITLSGNLEAITKMYMRETFSKLLKNMLNLNKPIHEIDLKFMQEIEKCI